MRRLVSPAGAVLAASLLLAGCEQDLYTGLTEVEANQMLAALIANGIAAGKTSKGKEGFTVAVDSSDMVRAIAILNDAGYPRNLRESIGKIFQKSGIMSSPFEERVRYIYALGEEVGATLGQIDGVVAARVHIVLPEAPQLGQPVKPSSAAVFIKHQPGVDLDFFVPQIRRLVSSSIEGLDPAAVTIVLTEARPTKVTTAPVETVSEMLPGVGVRDSDKGRFWKYVYFALGAIGVLLVANLATLAYVFRGRFTGAKAAPAAVAMVEPS